MLRIKAQVSKTIITAALFLGLFTAQAYADLERYAQQWGQDGQLTRYFDGDGREIYAVYVRYLLNQDGSSGAPREAAFYENGARTIGAWDNDLDGSFDSYFIDRYARHPDRATGTFGQANPGQRCDRDVQFFYYKNALDIRNQYPVGSVIREALDHLQNIENTMKMICNQIDRR